MSRFRRFVFAFWVALCLVVAQQAAALHDFTHAAERFAQHDGSKLPNPKCDTHFACSQLGSAVGASTNLALPLVHAAFAPVPSHGPGVARTAPAAYRSRAPPASFV